MFTSKILLALTASTLYTGSYYLKEKYNPIFWAFRYNKNNTKLEDQMYVLLKMKKYDEFIIMLKSINNAIDNYDQMPNFIKNHVEPINRKRFDNFLSECKKKAIIQNNLSLFELIKRTQLNFYDNSFDNEILPLIKYTHPNDFSIILKKYKNMFTSFDINGKSSEFYNIDANGIQNINSIGFDNFSEKTKIDIIMGLIANPISSESNINYFLDNMTNSEKKYLFCKIINNNELEKVDNYYNYFNKNCYFDWRKNYDYVMNKLISNNNINLNGCDFLLNQNSIKILCKNRMSHILDYIVKNTNQLPTNYNNILLDAYIDNLNLNHGKYNQYNIDTKIIINYLKKYHNITEPNKIIKIENLYGVTIQKNLEQCYKEIKNHQDNKSYVQLNFPMER